MKNITTLVTLCLVMFIGGYSAHADGVSADCSKAAVAGVINNAANIYPAVSISFDQAFPVQDLHELSLDYTTSSKRIYVSDPLDVPNNLHNLVFMGIEKGLSDSYRVKVFDAVSVDSNSLMKRPAKGGKHNIIYGLMCTYNVKFIDGIWSVVSVNRGKGYLLDTPAIKDKIKKFPDADFLGESWVSLERGMASSPRSLVSSRAGYTFPRYMNGNMTGSSLRNIRAGHR